MRLASIKSDYSERKSGENGYEYGEEEDEEEDEDYEYDEEED